MPQEQEVPPVAKEKSERVGHSQKEISQEIAKEEVAGAAEEKERLAAGQTGAEETGPPGERGEIFVGLKISQVGSLGLRVEGLVLRLRVIDLTLRSKVINLFLRSKVNGSTLRSKVVNLTLRTNLTL